MAVLCADLAHLGLFVIQRRLQPADLGPFSTLLKALLSLQETGGCCRVNHHAPLSPLPSVDFRSLVLYPLLLLVSGGTIVVLVYILIWVVSSLALFLLSALCQMVLVTTVVLGSHLVPSPPLQSNSLHVIHLFKLLLDALLGLHE